MLELFVLPGCHDCEEFAIALADTLLPSLAELGLRPEVRAVDILERIGYERLLAETARLGWDYKGVPLLKAGNRFFYGDELAAPDLVRAVSDALKGSPEAAGTPPEPGASAGKAASTPHPPNAPASGTGIRELNLWVVLGAGLVDGINPCALATLLFLVSVLALGGRNRASVAVIGISFVTGVFAAYFLMGLGLLKAGEILSTLPWLRAALRVLTSLGLWILGIFSLRDWRTVQQGRPTGDIALRLPDATMRRIHALIRKRSALWLTGFGAAGLGTLVSMSEFVCTGQIYLPTLVYIAQGGERGSLSLLAAYNLAFILPLAGVFCLVIAGMSHTRLTELFRKNLAASKLALALFFFAFGALMLAGVFS